MTPEFKDCSLLDKEHVYAELLAVAHRLKHAAQSHRDAGLFAVADSVMTNRAAVLAAVKVLREVAR